MKNAAVYVMLIFPILISSCSLQHIGNSKLANKFLGKWDIISITSSMKPDSILIQDFDAILRTLLIGAFIDFKSDHKFVAAIAEK